MFFDDNLNFSHEQRRWWGEIGGCMFVGGWYITENLREREKERVYKTLLKYYWIE
jgi:hypothetical protein